MLALNKSAQRLQNAFVRRVAGTRLSPAARELIEEALLEADLGYESASELATELATRGFRNPDSMEEVQTALRELVAKKMRACEAEEISLFSERRDKKGDGKGDKKGGEKGGEKELLVVVLLGLNGCGKTSAAGKLAARYRAQGANVLLAAGDTFRAAATEQLQDWATRSGAELVAAERHSDPAALAFHALAQARKKTQGKAEEDATEEATEEGYDVLLIDTAGRQHSDANLMQQLGKIERALLKQAAMQDKPPRIEFWLVLDATLGQTLRSQVKQFAAVVPVRRLLLTKLDSSACAGALVALAREKKPLPVQYLTAGEGLRDIELFRAQNFAEGLINLLPAPA